MAKLDLDRLEGKFVHLDDDPQYWAVVGFTRVAVVNADHMYHFGLREVVTVTDAELAAIPLQFRAQPVAALAGRYPRMVAYTVGSGPSVRYLDRSYFTGKGPVIAINQAVTGVTPLGLANDVYSLQKDLPLVDEPGCPILAHSAESAKYGDFGDYVFNCEADFSQPWYTPSAEVVMDLARLMGCKRVVYLCFDGAMGVDTRRWDGSAAVEVPNGEAYTQHKMMVEARAEELGIEVEWVLPEVGA